jgi:hypothetical protein
MENSKDDDIGRLFLEENYMLSLLITEEVWQDFITRAAFLGILGNIHKALL